MELRHLRLILRWSWLLIIFPILAVAAGFAFLQFQPTIYEARSVLIIGPGVDSPNPDLDALRAGAQLMETYAELPRTDAFLEGIISELDLDISTSDLNDLITIRTITDTQIMQIIVQDLERERAPRISNAVAEELVRLGPSNEQNDFLYERIRQQARNIENDILNLENRITANTEQLENEQNSVNRALLLEQITEDERRVSEANNTLAELYNVLQVPLTNRIAIIDRAEEANALSAQTALVLVVSAVAGLIVSGLVAIGLISIEEQVLDVENLRYLNDLLLMGVIQPTKDPRRLPVQHIPETPEAKQYYQLGAQMLYQRDSDNVYSIMFTSITEPDYVPEIVSNLALAIAKTQNSVFLLDVDFRKNGLSKVFEIEDGVQLSDLLQDESPSEIKVAEVNSSPHLKVLPSGASNTEAAFNMLASPKMLRIIRLLRQTSQQHRMLLLLAPPLSELQDGLTLVSQVDRVVLVANNRSLTKAQLQAAVEKLEAVGAKVSGIVITHRRALR